MDGWSLHFTVHPSISLSAKIHLRVMIEEGARGNRRPETSGAENMKWSQSRRMFGLCESWTNGRPPAARRDTLCDVCFLVFTPFH